MLAIAVYTGVILLCFCAILLGILNPGDKNANSEGSITKPTSYQSVVYSLYDEADISYGGCKRIGVKVLVPTGTTIAEIKPQLEALGEQYKNDWDDITIWAYDPIDESNIDFLLDHVTTYEYSVCE